MGELTWIARYPELYLKEVKSIENLYPRLEKCEVLLEEGILAYHGEIPVRLSSGTKWKKILLKYPRMFPISLPQITPLESLPDKEPHGNLTYLLVSARHQMSNRSLCLVERDPFGEAGVVRGVDILGRAKKWFVSVETGFNPYDSLEADLQSHLPKAGDILLGPDFYSDKLKVGGYFYAFPYLLSSGKAKKYVGLAYSSEFEADSGGVAKFKDCRNTLQIPFPWIGSRLWDAAEKLGNNSNALNEVLKSCGLIRGVWWNLDKEPLPPRNGNDILELICDANDSEESEKTINSFKTDITTETHLYIGLRYPNRKDGYEWLMCKLPIRNAQQNTPSIIPTNAKLNLFKNAPVFSLYVHSLTQKELLLRNEGRFPKKISESKISLFGVGSVGSTIADLLNKAGVGQLNLFDYDTLQTGNVIRHQNGIEDFGEPKVLTTSWKLAKHNPFTEVNLFNTNLLDSYQKIEDALSFQNDFVISSTADEPLETAINEVAVLSKKTVYYVRAMRGGTAGRIFRVTPGRDACRYCLTHYLTDSNNEFKEWLKIPELENTILSFECGNPILAASGIDLTFISSLCSKLVIEDIEKNFGDENHWLWSSESIEGHPDLQNPYKMVSKQIPPIPDCPFCSEPDIKEVSIPSNVQNKIEQLAIQAKENETGGILVGYFDENNVAIVTNASDPGPNSIMTPKKFLKDTEYTQTWLEKQIRESSESIEYIGEWHSHTNGDTSPSTTDIESLTGIMESPNYLCETPVMLILGTKEQKVIEKSAYVFVQNRPFQQIEYKSS